MDRELYISGPNRAGTSDQVFFTEHIDGPYILFPFASVFRCIVGLEARDTDCFYGLFLFYTPLRGGVMFTAGSR